MHVPLGDQILSKNESIKDYQARQHANRQSTRWAAQRAELVHSCHEAYLCCWPIVTPGPQPGWEYVIESTKE